VVLAIGWLASSGIGLFGILIFTLWIIGLVDLFRRPDLERGDRLRWMLLIVLLPIIGTIVYWVRRPVLPEERDKLIAAQTRGRDY
jgi:Phospholipase_D-nuclease N-terminal